MSAAINRLMHSENQPNLYKSCKTYTGIRGWFQNILGRTIKVINDRGATLYFQKKDLVKKLCMAANIDLKTVNVNKLADLTIEVLQPVKGINLTTEKVETLFQDVSCSFSNHITSHKELVEKFNELKNRHLTILTYQEDQLLKNLKPGDIFFKKNPDDSDNIVFRAQKVTTPFLLSKLVEREGYKFSHVAMYVGDGKIAEAVTAQDGGVQVRAIKLEDSRFALDREHGYKYLVTRSEDPELAQEAVKVAMTIVKPTRPKTEKQFNSNQHKYAFANAARSICHSSSFGLFAKQRYFKQYIDHKREIEPMNFMSPKDFFCSNFVSYCYQTAESLKVVPKIIGEKNEPPRSFTRFGQALYRGVWARVKRWKHLQALDKQINMKFDAKWVTPRDLRNFIVSNPALFKDKMLIKAD